MSPVDFSLFKPPDKPELYNFVPTLSKLPLELCVLRSHLNEISISLWSICISSNPKLCAKHRKTKAVSQVPPPNWSDLPNALNDPSEWIYVNCLW